MRKTRLTLSLGALAFVAACADSPTSAPLTEDVTPLLTYYGNPANFTGQGLIADGFGGFDLRTELCGVANGAEVDGPYLLFVLTATGANNATIDGPWGHAHMTKFGNGTFKFVAPWYNPSTLPGNVTATYDGKAKNAQLVVSHGCRPFTTLGAWCSPGYWRNARDGAWLLIAGGDPVVAAGLKAAFFDPTVATAAGFSAGSFGTLTTAALTTILGDPTTYSGPSIGFFDFDGAGGHPGADMNAFNATGAFLTSLIPGYMFDGDVMAAGGSDACPIDSFGNFKN